MNYIACIPKNCCLDLIGWQTHTGRLRCRFAFGNRLFPLLLSLRCVVLNPCFVHDYKKVHKLIRIVWTTQKKIFTLLHLWSMRANVAPNWDIAFTYSVILVLCLQHTRYCALQFPIGQHHVTDFLKCFGCNDLNLASTTLDAINAISVKFSKSFFYASNLLSLLSVSAIFLPQKIIL